MIRQILLMAAAAFVSSIGMAQDTSLVGAVIANDIEKFEELLAQGENPNSFQRTTTAGWLMCVVARESDTSFLDMAVKYGGDINLRHPDSSLGHSIPIACAISNGNVNGVESLLNYGVDTEARVCSPCGSIVKAYIPEYAFFAKRVDIALKLYQEVEFSQTVIDALIKVLEANNVRGEEQLRYQALLIDELEADGYQINLRKK